MLSLRGMLVLFRGVLFARALVVAGGVGRGRKW